MLTVTREHLPGGGIEITLTGHANAPRNPEGHDLVCAAASILCTTLATVLEKYCARPVCRLELGDALLRGVPRQGMVTQFNAAYDGVMGGFDLLAESHPECLEVAAWK